MVPCPNEGSDRFGGGGGGKLRQPSGPFLGTVLLGLGKRWSPTLIFKFSNLSSEGTNCEWSGATSRPFFFFPGSLVAALIHLSLVLTMCLGPVKPEATSSLPSAAKRRLREVQELQVRCVTRGGCSREGLTRISYQSPEQNVQKHLPGEHLERVACVLVACLGSPGKGLVPAVAWSTRCLIVDVREARVVAEGESSLIVAGVYNSYEDQSAMPCHCSWLCCTCKPVEPFQPIESIEPSAA